MAAFAAAPALLLLLVLQLAAYACAYLLVVSEQQPAGELVFDASLAAQLGPGRRYALDARRSAPFVASLLHVQPATGAVRLREPLLCDGLYYPSVFTAYVESTSQQVHQVGYHSLPLRLVVVGSKCEPWADDDTEEEDEDYDVGMQTRRRRRRDQDRRRRDILHQYDAKTRERLATARQWVSETLASYAIPTDDGHRLRPICLRRSQLIAALPAFLPATVRQGCDDVRFLDVSDDRFAIEHSQGDLVARHDTCIAEPLWRVTVLLTAAGCRPETHLVDADLHRLRLVFHKQRITSDADDDDDEFNARVRRELRNQSPFFEQALYVASVLEECDAGQAVTTVKARDPENSPVNYSMTSLLDSRSQGMFAIDGRTGLVTTLVRLDRELVDVHYFRVTAEDDQFPPRSGTTMLQVNVLDANDHGPAFERAEYEASVREGVSIGTTVITLKATDQDVGRNAEVEYSIQQSSGDEEQQEPFKIDAKTGVLATRALLDRETTEVYTLLVQASDLANPPSSRRSSTATVVVRLLDDNDNYPQFSERTYTVQVGEDLDWTQAPVVAQVRASDADAGSNAALRYALIGGNTQAQFAIDALTGDVSLVKPLDYEALRSYRLVVRAQDGGSPARSNTTQLLVSVRDVNDNAPRFYTTAFQEAVSEAVPVGYSVLRVQAYDADEAANADIRYALAPRDALGAPTDDIPLTVDPASGWVYTTRQLDREECSRYVFQVIASDRGTPPLSASASVLLTVQDVNDNDPRFEPRTYEAAVAEDEPPGTPVATVTATDADEDGRLHYDLTAGNTRGRFAVTSQNGRGLVTIAQPLDYKQERRFVLTVTATDSGGRQDTATIHVNISDANNFAPVFESAPYAASVFEDAPVGTTVLVVSATDNDVGANAQITYSLGDDSEGGASAGGGGGDRTPEFTINPQTGAIVTARPLDREVLGGYLLTVTARDGGTPPLSDTTDVEISVTDVNDNAPVFKQAAYAGSVPEDALVGTSVLQVSATDADIGLNGRIRYTLGSESEGAFVIDPASGVLRTNKGLDRESVPLYELQVLAVDRGSPPLSSAITVSVRLEDVNDSPPAFDADRLLLYVPENSPVGSTVGELYARDPDEGVNAIVQYSIIGGEDAASFSLVTRPGAERALLLTMVELDYESNKKRYELVVRAASPPLRSDVHVEVVVTDVNDNAPVLKDFQVIFNNFRDCFPAGPIGRIPAFDADVTDALHYRILSGNNANLVLLNATSGELVLSPQLNTNVPKRAAMEVAVTDGVNEAKAVMQLTVRLITEEMLYNSITVRLNHMTKEAFLSPLLAFFVDGLAAIIPCPKENIYVFSIQDDTDVDAKILNVSFSARRPDVPKEEWYSPQFLQERVYLNRAILARLATVQVLPFDDDLCVREPCLNYEHCLTVLRFGNASGFIHSPAVLFRPIYPVTAFACRCPVGFTGATEVYLCDTEVDLCYSQPCRNGGTCRRRESGYACECPENYAGDECQVELQLDPCQRPDVCKSGSTCSPLAKGGFVCEDCSRTSATGDGANGGGGYEIYTQLCELRSRSFNSAAFLTFPSLRQRHRLHLKLSFATQSENGLLLYNGRYNEKHDFLALEIVDGSVEFTFSLGSEATSTSVGIPGGVADGNWHTVQVQYYNRSVTISLDECDVGLALQHGARLGRRWSCANYTQQRLAARCALPAETCHRFLDLTGPLQVGGLPSLPGSFRVRRRNYRGCIADLAIDHKLVDLNSFVADNGTLAGCPEKRTHCSSNPCKHNGVCAEGWLTYKCHCADGYSGKDCSEVITQTWSFSGDGMLSYNPLLRPIQLPWVNALSVRTLQPDAFLMSVQIGQNSSAVMFLKNGLLHYAYNGERLHLAGESLADGRWHHLEAHWLGGEQLLLRSDYGQRQHTASFGGKVQGLYVGRVVVGGSDSTYEGDLLAFLEGCVQDVRIGAHHTSHSPPTVKRHVADGCSQPQVLGACAEHCPAQATCRAAAWSEHRCDCQPGHVGEECLAVCDLQPCQTPGICVPLEMDKRGYKCQCNSTEYSGDYCELKVAQPCPAGWWGYPVCGPCQCDASAGHDPDCDKATGACRCRDHHYQPPAADGAQQCLACDCYSPGAYSARCDPLTGQCRCRAGVIGQRCDSCPNPYAEVTLRGCEVVYDGCPKSYAAGLWWPRTTFGATAVEKCPPAAIGRAARACDNQLGGWQPPDMFNCTSDHFVELRKQLSQIEKGQLTVNTFVAVKMALDLQHATNATQQLYGADVLIAQKLIRELLKHENRESGLNLTHSQDKDYIKNIIQASSVILDAKYQQHWARIEQLAEDTADMLITAVENYIDVLSGSQRDTYTNPFEIVSPNMVLGLDVVTAESLYGYEPEQIVLHNHHQNQDFSTERVIVLPDTSQFLQPGLLLPPSSSTSAQTSSSSAVVAFPKYNNYLEDKHKFDPYSRLLVPLSLLGIKQLEHGELTTKSAHLSSSSSSGAVIAYAQYRQAGSLLPAAYDASVVRRWGVDVAIASPVISVGILVPEDTIPTTKRPAVWPEKAKKTTEDEENETRRRREARVRYRSLARVPLPQPIRLRLWLDPARGSVGERANPQCVHWSQVKGYGEWSRIGCRTELPASFASTPVLVNCTCSHLSTFALLVDVVEPDYIPEPSLLEDIASYSSFCLSLPLLFVTLLLLMVVGVCHIGSANGSATNSNAIHRNLVLCILLAELLFFVALKARRPLIENAFSCKLMAISLHYVWLCAFAWQFVDALHLYRMLTEMRDINHGQMRFYYTVGYVVPAIIVILTVGVRVDQYGNIYFCWLSLYESVVWSLIGPICLLVFANLLLLALCTHAAFTLKEHVLAFGSLRTLLWLSVLGLPLLCIVWLLAVLSVSEHSPLLTYLLSLVVLSHAVFSLVGYCFVNERVRRQLGLMLGRGGKVPTLLEANSAAEGNAEVAAEVGSPQRYVGGRHKATTAHLPAHLHRHVGISASSTTSRSTAKTSSSPYRSDAHLRHNTSTSTSNYNSASDMMAALPPSYRKRHDSDTDEEEEDEGRSLDLASSHSSDEETSTTQQRRARGRLPARDAYLPNITEHVVSSRCGSPPALNIVTNSQLFPNIGTPPTNAGGGRWTSQLPDGYLPNLNVDGNSALRWSGETTASDNEVLHVTSSPNPLPNPEDTPFHHQQHQQYYVQTNTDDRFKTTTTTQRMMQLGKLMDYDQCCSEADAAGGGADKYSFPYTAEEDHCGSSLPPYMANIGANAHARLMATSSASPPLPPLLTNDINNPSMPPEYMSGRISGSRMQTGSSLRSNVSSMPSPNEKDAETSV